MGYVDMNNYSLFGDEYSEFDDCGDKFLSKIKTKEDLINERKKILSHYYYKHIDLFKSIENTLINDGEIYIIYKQYDNNLSFIEDSFNNIENINIQKELNTAKEELENLIKNNYIEIKTINGVYKEKFDNKLIEILKLQSNIDINLINFIFYDKTINGEEINIKIGENFKMRCSLN